MKRVLRHGMNVLVLIAVFAPSLWVHGATVDQVNCTCDVESGDGASTYVQEFVMTGAITDCEQLPLNPTKINEYIALGVFQEVTSKAGVVLTDKPLNCVGEKVVLATSTKDGNFEFSDDIKKSLVTLNPLGTFTPQQLLGRVIKSVLGILGSIALVIFLYGGITWMTSMGSSEKIQKALSTIVWGALGVIVILASYSIVGFVLENIPK